MICSLDLFGWFFSSCEYETFYASAGWILDISERFRRPLYFLSHHVCDLFDTPLSNLAPNGIKYSDLQANSNINVPQEALYIRLLRLCLCFMPLRILTLSFIIMNSNRVGVQYYMYINHNSIILRPHFFYFDYFDIFISLS